MTEIYLRAIYALLFELVCNSGGRVAALGINNRLVREREEYEARQSELANTDSGRSSGTERDSGGSAVRGGVGSGAVPDATRSGNFGI